MQDTTTQRSANDHADIIEVVIELLKREMPAVIDGLIEDCTGGRIAINIDSSGTRANVELPPPEPMLNFHHGSRGCQPKSKYRVTGQ